MAASWSQKNRVAGVPWRRLPMSLKPRPRTSPILQQPFEVGGPEAEGAAVDGALDGDDVGIAFAVGVRRPRPGLAPGLLKMTPISLARISLEARMPSREPALITFSSWAMRKRLEKTENWMMKCLTISRSAAPLANHLQYLLSVITGWVMSSLVAGFDEGRETAGVVAGQFAVADLGFDLVRYFQLHA